MAAKKYFGIVSGIQTLIAGVQTSAGAGDGGKIVSLDDTGKLSSTMMPAGIGADTVVAPATEALNAGDYIDLYNNAGTMSARKADGSTTGKPAAGFVLSAVTNGANATVYRAGTNTALTGLTAGNDVWLSTSAAGGITQTPPDESVAGKTIQFLGVASGTTAVSTQLGLPIHTS